MNLRGQAGMIVPLIFLVVFVLIAFNLAPTIANQSVALTSNQTAGAIGGNLTSAGSVIANLIPLLYIIIVVVTVLGFVAMRGE